MQKRTAVAIVAALNLAYFGVEFAVALAIGSVSLFADSVDFLEDASVNILIAVALGWTATNRARLGDGTRWYPSNPRSRDPMDGLDQAQRSCASVAPAAIAGGVGRARGQSVLRAHSRPLQAPQWQSDQSRVPVGSKRCHCQRRSCGHRLNYSFPLALGLARSCCWTRDSRHKCGCSTGSLGSGTRGTPDRAFLATRLA